MLVNRWIGFIIAVFVLTITIIGITNSLLIHQPQSEPKVIPVPLSAEIPSAAPKDYSQISSSDPDTQFLNSEIMRKTMVIRGGDIREDIFLKDGKEIAHITTYQDGKTEVAGSIPEGKVKFVDEYNKTYGEEQYLNGKKFGPQKTFYANGKIQSESVYANDRLIKSKEYYSSGNLRLEVDYSDARESKGTEETGVGKLYYPDGKVKFEWNLTQSQSTGFKRSYHADGNIRAEMIFDSNGQIIQNRTFY